MLNNLKVESDCQNPSCSRKSWQHWVDEDGDGQTTRQEVLIAERLIYPQLKDDSKTVVSGRWYDPYTDATFSNPSDLDIDHLAPLGEAHKSGGCHWTVDKRGNLPMPLCMMKN